MNHSLKLAMAFIVVILIWSTTPLAIQWSTGTTPLTSVAIRMVIGFTFCGLFLGLQRSALPFDRQFWRIYILGGVSIFVSMVLVYLAAESVPSGWIAILFALSPLITGLLTPLFEPGSGLTSNRIAGIFVGLAGLASVFHAGIRLQPVAVYGMGLVLLMVFISASTSVVLRHWVKSSGLKPIQLTSGSLVVALPFFIVTAFLFEHPTLATFTNKELIAITYLGIMGTGIGFILYYFLLSHTSANNVALITMITPITSLSLGTWLNGEPFSVQIIGGALCVVVGLILYQYKPRIGFRRL